MMKYNLGWTDKVDAYGQHWFDWPFYIRIIQTDASGNILNNTNPQNVDNTGAADVFCVTQYGESIKVDANVGSNCFYQWGRKDPLLPGTTTGDNTTSVNKRVYSAKYSLSDIVESNVKVKTVQNNGGKFGQSIQNPHQIFFARGSYMYVGVAINNSGASINQEARYGNLWDTGQIAHCGATGGNALSIVNRLPIKSVYDPSPRGYTVPWAFAFTGFSNQAWNVNNPSTPIGSAATDGYNFSDGNGGSIYFPYAGARGGDGVNPLYDVTSTMYYWSAGRGAVDITSGETYRKSRNLTFLKPNDIRAIWEQYCEGAYAVRPALQVAF